MNTLRQINSTTLNNAPKGNRFSILKLPNENSTIKVIKFGVSEENYADNSNFQVGAVLTSPLFRLKELLYK